jgi:DMSO/TMAO reductase YedYZ molybdopterin-dependent catalytic subunit
LVFIVLHVTFVFTTGLLVDLNHVYAGRTDGSWIGFWFFAASMVVAIVGWVAATPFTIRAVGGLVENPVDLNLAALRALPHHEITQHFCIQGWSGIAKWGGVSMLTIVDLVKPHPDAKWGVFYSLGDGADKGVYYDAHPIEHMTHHLTMLAYDMNDEPLTFGHGGPLRLRNKIELGFKQVKWLAGIEFVAHYSEVGGGYGGYNQDHEFFGHASPPEGDRS